MFLKVIQLVIFQIILCGESLPAVIPKDNPASNKGTSGQVQEISDFKQYMNKFIEDHPQLKDSPFFDNKIVPLDTECTTTSKCVTFLDVLLELEELKLLSENSVKNFNEFSLDKSGFCENINKTFPGEMSSLIFLFFSRLSSHSLIY